MTRRLILALALVAGASVLAGQPTGRLIVPPAIEGNVGGATAVLIWPVTADVTPLDPSNCAVRLVPYADLDRELSFDCGVWFLPPPGDYKLWVEKAGAPGGAYIGAAPAVLKYAGGAFSGQGVLLKMATLPAGEVALKEPRTAAESFRVIQLFQGRGTQRTFDRRAPAQVVKPILMPVGEVLAGLFDRKSNDAIALTRPLKVVADQLTYARPAPATQGSDVLAIVERPALRSKESGEFQVSLRVDGVEKRPDVLSDGPDRVICVWYGVEGRAGELSARSEALHVPATPVRLRAGTVTTVRAKLVPLPSAKASIDVPSGVELPASPVLEVRKGGRERALLRSVSAKLGENVLAALPPEELTLVLRIAKWSFVRTADLRSGDEVAVDFHLAPFVVSGTVFHGGDRVEAKLGFGEGKEDATEAAADVDGEYRVTLWKPSVYTARVMVPGAPPFIEGFLSLEGSAEVDFHVPRNRYTLHVRDEADGAAVPGAKVTVRTVWKREADTGDLVEAHVVDAAGDVTLPPLRTGDAVLQAFAEGFEPSERLTVPVSERSGDQELTIRVRRQEVQAKVTILRPGGAPAEGAEVLVAASDNLDRMLWSGKCGSEGVELPKLPEAGYLLVRDRGYASLLVPYRDGVPPPTLRLLPEGSPITVQVVTSGGEPARFARLAVWVAGIRVTTLALGFLTWTQPALASADGTWSPRGLSPAPLRAFAWRRDTAGALSGAYDSVARELAFPWPQRATLTTVD